MWSDDQFRTYLSSQGKEAQWHAVVVPGMKKAVIHALQVTQDLIDSCKNSFELYGADFMMGKMRSKINSTMFYETGFSSHTSYFCMTLSAHGLTRFMIYDL